jgi:HEAT repeat protein
LRAVVESEHGPGVVEAAAAALRRHADEDVAQPSLGQLVRAIEGAARVTRLQAIAEAPLDRRELLRAVEQATADDDSEVKVAALGRLAETHDARAVAELEGLAHPGSPVAETARLVLAAVGDRRVQAWIEDDLRSDRSEVKLAAATALVELGVAARAAPLLADADASVRVRAACAIVASARFPR